MPRQLTPRQVAARKAADRESRRLSINRSTERQPGLFVSTENPKFAWDFEEDLAWAAMSARRPGLCAALTLVALVVLGFAPLALGGVAMNMVRAALVPLLFLWSYPYVKGPVTTRSALARRRRDQNA